MTVDLPGPFWMVGCGNMAGAMLAGWLEVGIDRAQITVIRPSGEPVGEGIRVLTRYPEDEVPALAMLGMKPYQLDEVAAALAPILEPETVLVSILAGAELASQRARFPRVRNLVRAMPNTPVKLGKGVTGLYSDSDDPEARETVENLMGALGHARWFDEETMFNIVMSLTGSGPAFLFRFIDALAAAAADLGVPEEEALELATAMVEGAAALAAAAEESPAELARAVASPGGSTRAGLDVLDRDHALRDLLKRTLAAARERSLEMAAEARRSS
ncbi:MAG: pyrroline-5-carboxylate reductase [Sphingomonadaceae bacterium]